MKKELSIYHEYESLELLEDITADEVRAWDFNTKDAYANFGLAILKTLNKYQVLNKKNIEICVMTKNGNMAVDLFFIISGFFFTLKLNTTKTLWQFLKKKLIRLYPVAIFIFFLGWLGHSLFGLYKLSIYDSILILFGLSK